MSPAVLLLWAALAPLVIHWGGGFCPRTSGDTGDGAGDDGQAPPQRGNVSCTGFSLSACTVFACFTSSVQRGWSEEERSCVYVRGDLVTHPLEARASFAASHCVEKKGSPNVSA